MDVTTREVRHETFIDWRAAILAGLAAGLVFLILEMVMVPLFLGGSPWAPPRMIGAIIMGRDVLPPPGTFHGPAFLAATVVHFALSAIYGIVVGFMTHRTNIGTAVLVGLAFGLVLYFVNFYLFTEQFPWFANARNWVTIFSHIVFGGLVGWFYKRMAA